MDFLSGDFDNLSQDDEEYEDNFESSANFCQRITCLYHTILYLFYVKKQIRELPPDKKGIGTDQLKGLRPGDTAANLSKRISQKYQEHIDRKESG
jgi:hypothetical protein